MSECNADLDRVCNSGNNGEPCISCVENEAYWRNWGRSQRFERYTEGDVLDAYSSPAERSKRDSLLARI